MKSILFSYYPLFVHFNYGIALLTAICKKAGIKADYVPCTELKNRAKDFDIIGFSFVTDHEYEKSKPFIKIVKDMGKQIIAGGGYAKKGGRIEEIKSVCRGEAEDFIVDYLSGYEDAFKAGYVRPSIDGLPMPDLSNVKGNEFHRDQEFLERLKIIPYQSSRGCFYGKCSFCEVQLQSDKKVRIKHTMTEDLDFLKRFYLPDLICFFDTTMPYILDEWREQLEDFCFPFQGYIRADIEPSHLEFLIKHGLRVTAFGVESPYEDIRNNCWRKGVTHSQLWETTRILRKHGIIYITFFMQESQNIEERQAIKELSNLIGGHPIIWKKEDLARNIERIRI